MKQRIAEDAADVLKTLGHPLRLQIMEGLHRGEKSVGDIAATVNKNEPYVSNQLSIMKAHGLLRRVRCGRTVHYGVRDAKLAKCLHCIWSSDEKNGLP